MLLQILLKPYRILQKIPADFFRAASLDGPAQQVNIVKIQCAEAMRSWIFLQVAFTDIAVWNRQLFRFIPEMLRQNALLDGGIGVVFAQTVQPDKLLSVRRLDSGMLSLPGVDLIACFSQTVQKGRKVEGLPDYIINVPAYLLPDGRPSGFRCLPFLMAFSFAFRLDNGQTIFAAQIIGHFLDFVKIGFHIAPQFPAVQKGHRVDCDVVVQMVLIEVRSNDHLKPISKQPPRKLHTDGVGLLWGNLTRLKGLNDVIALCAAGLVVAPFGTLHIPAGIFDAFAVQTAFKQPLFGLIRVDSVFDYAGKRGLFLVGGILNGFLKPASYGEYFGDRHFRTP